MFLLHLIGAFGKDQGGWEGFGDERTRVILGRWYGESLIRYNKQGKKDFSRVGYYILFAKYTRAIGREE